MNSIGSFIPVPFSETTVALLKAGPAQPLGAVSPSIGVYSEHVAEKPTGLVLQSDPFGNNGEDFIIRDLEGKVRLVCRTNTASGKHGKVITDPNGNILVSLKSKLSISKSYTGEDVNGKEVLKVKKKFALGSSFEASFHDLLSSKSKSLQLRGDFWLGSADILVVSGPLIAQFSRRKVDGEGLNPNKETYIVNVAPGVDLAMITAICICFEQASKDS
ncbi:hypothetical protein I302_102474 [Kwoniella bestiolae CBS 10118]|uniref:Uncharacterized protein n=1 Tax=Kwoniella bestiolae CBS 10118 TaxID=1296100 RepID=A0A1B9GF38_9TREE|nr:hypothetical protein I302_01164 [Kwoniella bestiolae CBS 10118]OCF29653.1 hypothetical protein I302_01164 [Kwoniella bestiolae CBS 10118]